MKLIRLLLVISFFHSSVFCQDITGLWTGTIYNDSSQQYYQYEIGIGKENGKYIGYSHTWFVIEGKKFYGVKKLKVKIASDGKIVIQDGELLLNNYSVKPNKDIRQLNILDFQKEANDEVLTGLFVTNRTKEFLPITGKINLKKTSFFTQSDLVLHLQLIGKGQELSFINSGAEPLVLNER